MAKNYWEERLARSQEKLTTKSIRDTETQLKKYYKSAMQKIVGQFEATYNKYLLSIEDGREPTPADLYKLDTYWKMQAQLRDELQKLGDKQVDLLSKKFMEQWESIYNAVAIQAEDTLFNKIDIEAAKQMINSIWCADGKSWSDRIWTNTSKLQQSLNDNLIDCVLTGKQSRYLKQQLVKEFEVDYKRADSIVRTELAHIQTEAAKQRYVDSGIKEVEVWADEDERRCDVCGDLHEKRFPIGGKMPVPAHPRCRCCILPVVEIEEYEQMRIAEPTTQPASQKQKLTLQNDNGRIIYTEEQLNKIDEETKKINSKLGKPINYYGRIEISDLGKHGAMRMQQRGIAQEDAQRYIDNAIICYQQSEDKILYLSEEGVCVMITEGRISTAYPREWFNQEMEEILKVVKKYGKNS